MQLKEVESLNEKIDIHYNTEYSKNDNLVKEWYKELKKYDSVDVFRKLEEHLRSNFSNIPPKLFYLTKDLVTPEQKISMGMISTNCTICGRKLNLLDFDAHFEKCSKILFIKENVKTYLNQDINVEEYYIMSDQDITKRWEKIANIVLQKSDNELLKKCIMNYFNTREENNEK